ncbi:type I restriction enzyme, R subunit [Candidatus Methanophagaceae archaeon]|nr:type I restriction enzyme, R subunit [Methanophagales archaeon]
MNEAETRAELIDPLLKESGWGVIEDSKVLREYHITLGKLQTGAGRAKPLISDYILVYKSRKLTAIEAKSAEKEVGEGVAQAKNYAEKLHLLTTFATNGNEIYQICMETGSEGLIQQFPTPDELWNKTFKIENNWKDKYNAISNGGIYKPRFFQEISTNKALDAIAEEKDRLLLTLATGTGKTNIAFQIAWKLFHARWNLKWDGTRRPRILYLADRNNLANQAFNEFSAFGDALVRIRPDEIRKKGSVPTNGSIFFTIFQTFMSGPNDTPYFGEYPKDYFDFIINDECHRGGANDEGNWRAIMEYFSPAVQLGLTATPKRDENADTYKYFGEPLYVYSLKEGINDGFLTPFKVRRIKTTMDDYVYTSDDMILEGKVEAGKIYTGTDWNKIIEIKAREAYNTKLLLQEINQNEKGIVFCATQDHALAIMELINQYKKSTEPNYCVRVTANDGKLGDQYLAEFRDNEKTIPTILTTSQKLSTGVDARNIRSIVLMRPINSMIEFKQIIG